MNNMKKIIIFYALFTIVVILSATEMTLVTGSALFITLVALGSFVCSVGGKEIEKISGADFFNKALNTNDFTEE